MTWRILIGSPNNVRHPHKIIFSSQEILRAEIGHRESFGFIFVNSKNAIKTQLLFITVLLLFTTELLLFTETKLNDFLYPIFARNNLFIAGEKLV